MKVRKYFQNDLCIKILFSFLEVGVIDFLCVCVCICGKVINERLILTIVVLHGKKFFFGVCGKKEKINGYVLFCRKRFTKEVCMVKKRYSNIKKI